MITSRVVQLQISKLINPHLLDTKLQEKFVRDAPRLVTSEVLGSNVWIKHSKRVLIRRVCHRLVELFKLIVQFNHDLRFSQCTVLYCTVGFLECRAISTKYECGCQQRTY